MSQYHYNFSFKNTFLYSHLSTVTGKYIISVNNMIGVIYTLINIVFMSIASIYRLICRSPILSRNFIHRSNRFIFDLIIFFLLRYHYNISLSHKN